jgi:DNA-binding SARP family transcriptional activator/RecA/RadA recombinase
VTSVLHIRLLGELEVSRDGRALSLPPSKKARALLAYLVVTGRSHSRERLCDLLWDVTDDPRAALRWCLSKLRPVVDAGRTRLDASRTHVALDLADVTVDVLELKGIDRLETLPTAQLERMLQQFRGEFLEGLDLPDFAAFHAWWVAHREEHRRLHSRILAALLDRAGATPERALALARAMADLEPQDGAARALLLELLHASGRYSEAEEQSRTSRRLLGEIPTPATNTTAPAPSRRGRDEPLLVGRSDQLSTLERVVLDPADDVRGVVVYGEAGSGKSRLLSEIVRRATAQGRVVALGRGREEHPGWPYAPWVDLLASLGENTLTSELRAPVDGAGDLADASRREQRFAATVEAIDRVGSRGPLLVVIDDAQWLDSESASLCDYLVTHARHGVRIVLAARPGALADNMHAARLIRSLRRDPRFSDVVLPPLTIDEATELVVAVGAGADAARIVADAAGNPLFLIELARAPRKQAGELPKAIGQSIRDRLELLPVEHADAIRWAAVLGTRFDAILLERLLGVAPEVFVATVERLEQHGWISLAPTASAAAGFTHDVVRRAVYDGLSDPRRRLMHARVAAALAEREEDPATLAHHAALGGDAAAAAQACLLAMRRCLRLAAIPDAMAMSRRGATYARQLAEPGRTTTLLELLQPSVVSANAEELGALLAELSELTDRAMDLGALEHARLGCLSRAMLRWHEGQSVDVRRLSLQMERISRLGTPRERVLGLGEAAHCLVAIESDLPFAEALVLEGEALGRREGAETYTIPLTTAMLRAHRGELDGVDDLLGAARDLARVDGNRLGEFYVLEQRFDLELVRGRADEALMVAEETVRVAQRVREGSEAPLARALVALARLMAGSPVDAALNEALAELALVDAKQRIAYVAGRAACLELARGRRAEALGHARTALEAALAIGRPSEIAIARAALVRSTDEPGTADGERPHLRALSEVSISAFARRAVEDALVAAGDYAPRGKGAHHGARDRRARVR